MIYLTIISFMITLYFFVTDMIVAHHNSICFLISSIVSGFLLTGLVILIDCSSEAFEVKTISVEKKEMSRKQIFSLDMISKFTNQFFILSKEDGAYNLYVKNKTGFEKANFSIVNTELKQCDKENSVPCVVETLTTTTKKYIPKYKKFLYYGIAFSGNPNRPEWSENKTTYTLYLPENAVIQ